MKKIVIVKAENGWILDVQHSIDQKHTYSDLYICAKPEHLIVKLRRELINWGGEGE